MIFKQIMEIPETYALTVGNQQLVMSREEAEQLFLDIGHALQDADLKKYSNEGMDEECPTT